MIDQIKVTNLLAQIGVADTIELVGDCPAVHMEWDSDVRGESENQVLLLTWEDNEHQEFSVILTEQGLSDAEIDGNYITCDDHEGNTTYIRLWKHQAMDIEENLKCGANYP